MAYRLFPLRDAEPGGRTRLPASEVDEIASPLDLKTRGTRFIRTQPGRRRRPMLGPFAVCFALPRNESRLAKVITLDHGLLEVRIRIEIVLREVGSIVFSIVAQTQT